MHILDYPYQIDTLTLSPLAISHRNAHFTQFRKSTTGPKNWTRKAQFFFSFCYCSYTFTKSFHFRKCKHKGSSPHVACYLLEYWLLLRTAAITLVPKKIVFGSPVSSGRGSMYPPDEAKVRKIRAHIPYQTKEHSTGPVEYQEYKVLYGDW